MEPDSKNHCTASPVVVRIELGPQDTSERSQLDKGGKHNAHSPSSYGEPKTQASHPIHLHRKFFPLRVVCRAIPFFISMGSSSLGFSLADSEAARASQSLRLQEEWYLISQKLFSMLTTLSSEQFQRFKPTKGTEHVRKTCNYSFYQLRVSTTNSSWFCSKIPHSSSSLHPLKQVLCHVQYSQRRHAAAASQDRIGEKLGNLKCMQEVIPLYNCTE